MMDEYFYENVRRGTYYDNLRRRERGMLKRNGDAMRREEQRGGNTPRRDDVVRGTRSGVC